MKKSVCLVVSLFSTVLILSQSSNKTWEEMMGDPTISLFEIQEAYNAYWDTAEIPKGAGHKPYKRWEYLMETRVDANGYYDPLERNREYFKYFSRHSPLKSLSNPWIALGPSSQPSGNNGVGRINVIAVHPSNSNIIFVGTPAGGLWKSTDGGSSWSTVTDTLANLGISDITFDPVNPDIMYLATGDRDHNDTSTFGIIKSSDGGNTWTLTDFQPSTNGLPPFYLIHRLLIDPNDGNIMIASTTSGVFRTTDGWSSWSEVLPNDCIRHMEFKPGDSNIVYGTTSGAYCGGLNGVATYFRSTDNGQNWTQVTLPHTTDIQRIALGVTADNPNVVYMLAAYNDPSNSNDFFALYKSTDSGATVNEVTVNNDPVLGSQQWYDWSFTISPSNEDILFAGGVAFRKSTDGGVSWTSSGAGVHVDHHFARYFGSTLYVGSDGGIWKSTDNGASFTSLNSGLAIGQYYRISNAETDNILLLAGAQDNGTHKNTSSGWTHEFGGDGMDNAIDPSNDNKLYLSYQYGHFYYSVNGGSTYSTMINDNTTGVNGAWVTPIKIDPSHPDTLYTGYDRVWKSTDGGFTWSDPSGTALTNNTSIQYIDVADSNGDYIYVTDYSNIWRSTDGGNSWTILSDPGSSIRWIEIDPADENHLWVCASHDIKESSDGGASWINITGSLPNIAMNTIVCDKGSNEALYVGSDLGVFYKDASMTDWSPFGVGLPNVIVLELDIHENENKIRAATFGRGIWEANLNAVQCSVDNIIDLAMVSCDDAAGNYSRKLEILYSGEPLTGNLEVNSQSFPIQGSPQTIILNGLPVDGQSEDVTAYFSSEPNCSLTINDLFTNPSVCPCLLSDANIQITGCDDKGTVDPADDSFSFSVNPEGENTSATYSVSGDVTASSINYGSPYIFDNNGNGYDIINGDLSITIIDDTNSLCLLSNQTVTAPSPCSTNYTCGTAFELTSNGMYTAIGPDQGNGGSQPGFNANWYYFTAPNDGVITVESCEGGVDTRLFFHSGSCGGLNLLDMNDDFCEMSPGAALYASYLEMCVQSGVTYYIEWDDRWSSQGFDFDFEYIPGTPATPTVNNFPYNEGFENLPNSWVLSCEDDFNWSNHTGSTPSSNTGPSSAQEGSRYIYTEASNNFQNTSYHIGPVMDFNSNNGPEMSFYYHMYGADMGTLSLELSNNGGNSWATIWTKTGDQGDQWHLATIDLASYAGTTVHLRFKGQMGPAYTSDMAIDNISVIDINPSDCIPVETINDVPIPDSTYSAMIIHSAGVVPPNGNVSFEALNEVNLNEGFMIDAGAVFQVLIGNCNSLSQPQNEAEEK